MRLVEQALAEAGVTAPPVPVDEIIRSRGIQLHYPDLGSDVSGVLLREPTRTVIGVNRKHSKARQRFTMAHELGHALLHSGDPVHFDEAFRVNLRSGLSAQGTSVEEMEANAFAASLLMPRAFLEAEPAVAQLDIEDPAALGDLAKRYGVSGLAMGFRLANLLARKTG